MSTSAKTEAPRASQRLVSIDAYRGLVMFLMMAEVLAIGSMAKALPESAFWKFLHWQQDHVAWVGCVLHDLIQPSFSFLVGVALPFSIASRAARGQSAFAMTGHALWRSLILILLGVFLRSVGRPQTNWTFEDTLTQIGLGYPFLFVLGLSKPRVQFGALVIVLAPLLQRYAPLRGARADARLGRARCRLSHRLAAHRDEETLAAPIRVGGGGHAHCSPRATGGGSRRAAS